MDPQKDASQIITILTSSCLSSIVISPTYHTCSFFMFLQQLHLPWVALGGTVVKKKKNSGESNEISFRCHSIVNYIFAFIATVPPAHPPSCRVFGSYWLHHCYSLVQAKLNFANMKAYLVSEKATYFPLMSEVNIQSQIKTNILNDFSK